MVRKEDRGFACEVSQLKKWKDNSNIMNDIRYAALRMNKMDIPKKPNRIECTDEIYNRIRSLIWLRLNSCNELIFPWGNPFDILFLQTDFSEWSSDDLKRGYRIICEE